MKHLRHSRLHVLECFCHSKLLFATRTKSQNPQDNRILYRRNITLLMQKIVTMKLSKLLAWILTQKVAENVSVFIIHKMIFQISVILFS